MRSSTVIRQSQSSDSICAMRKCYSRLSIDLGPIVGYYVLYRGPELPTSEGGVC